MNTEFFKYGYYTAGPFNHITRSKLEAIEWCMPHRSWPTWHFHDEVFASYNWTQEPSQSLEELYQQRARQLRERYDYLILTYSGGYDSHNMLMSFLSQGIVPDEILNFYHSYQEDVNIMGYEWHIQTKPRLNKIKEKFPNIKIRRIDLTPSLIDYIQNPTAEQDIYSSLGRYAVRPNTFVRCNITHTYPEYLKYKHQGQSLRILQGVDKPRLRYHHNRFIFNFYDFANSESSITPESDDHEWFYWSPESAKILIKQAHIVKRFWEQHLADLSTMQCRYDDKLGWVLQHNNDLVCKLLYPWHDNAIYLTENASDGFVGSRDRQVLAANYQAAEKYVEICHAVINRIDPMYFNQMDPTKGAVGSISRDYFLS